MAINKYSTAIDNSLEKYVALPFQEMMQAGAAIQQRGDLAEQQQMQVQTGLASMEALTPGYAQFRDKFSTDYKTQAGTLLDKYQGNTSNPEFIRDIKRLNMQYANDPRLQTIKQGNELYKQNQQIATKMRAEGKLFINPKFTGVDERGNLTANVPGLEAVNTLEDWTNSIKVAHDSMEDIGTKSTNARNLKNWKTSIMGDTAGIDKLTRAYISQGMSPEQAAKAVQNNISGLANTYGKVEKTNTALLGYQLNRDQFAYQKKQDAAKLDIDRYKAETVRMKKAGKDDDLIKAPSFNEFTNRIGSIGQAGKDGEKYIFGSGMSQYGTSDKAIKNQKISGKIYDISEGVLMPSSKSVDIANGTLKGYMNAWVDKKTGKLLETATPTSKPKINYINGKPYAYKDGKPYEIEERTMAEYNYNAAKAGQDPDIRTIYKEAAPKEAMREMGYSNAYYSGMGRTQHGSVFDTKNKARIDEKFIQSNNELRSYLPAFKDAQDKVNKGIATQADLDLLNGLQSYDTRKSTYDNEILPYFKDQSKTKTIVEDE